MLPFLLLAPAYTLLVLADAPAVAVMYALASRLAYVGYVGWALRAEETRRHFSAAHGVARGFDRFRRTARAIMTNDGIAFVVLCWVTRDSLAIGLSDVEAVLVGGALIAVGVATKVAAARTLGTTGYYWYDFFAPRGEARRRTDGVYRFLSNPMYTIGYLQTYGLAVLVRSWPGLLVSLFDQLAILGFYLVVERPHYERLYGKARDPGDERMPVP